VEREEKREKQRARERETQRDHRRPLRPPSAARPLRPRSRHDAPAFRHPTTHARPPCASLPPQPPACMRFFSVHVCKILCAARWAVYCVLIFRRGGGGGGGGLRRTTCTRALPLRPRKKKSKKSKKSTRQHIRGVRHQPRFVTQPRAIAPCFLRQPRCEPPPRQAVLQKR
jgi:hypothetical protein